MLGFFKGLGIGLLCLLLFVAGVVFNVEFLGKKTQEKEMEIKKYIQVQMPLKSDIFTARIDFYPSEALSTKSSLTNVEREQISQLFKEIIKRNEKDNFCVGGAYSLEANFDRENGFIIPKGQRLNAKLECEIKAENLNAFNVLIQDMNNIIAKSEWVKISTPALLESFSKNLLAENAEKLDSELLIKAYEYEKKYSKDFNRTCSLSSFILQSHLFEAESLRANNGLSLPISGKHSQKAGAQLSFYCK